MKYCNKNIKKYALKSENGDEGSFRNYRVLCSIYRVLFLVLGVTCAKFHQSRAKTVDLYKRHTHISINIRVLYIN